MAAAGAAFTNPLIAVLGYALGTGIGPVLRPLVQDELNLVWAAHRVRKFDVNTAAALWTEGVWTQAQAREEGGYTGFSEGHVDALRQLLDDPPSLDLLYQLLRRGRITNAKFQEALRHLRIETDYYDDLSALANVLLTPEQLANARQRGFVNQAEQYAEAALQGISNARAEIEFELSGLPPPPERAREMWRRGILSEAEFRQAIVEGNEKLKYVDEEVALFNPLLTVHEIVNLRLRGWIDTATMNERGALHGYTDAQMHDLFLGQGRPLTFHQVFIGERRGGTYDGATAEIEPAFLKSLQESSVRPEWYNLAWAQRHTYPSAFVLRALVQSGDLSADEGYAILLRIGWPETLARSVADRWGGGTGAAADPHVAKAQTQLWSTTHRTYIANESTEADARTRFDLLAIPAAAQATILTLWESERELIRKQLTPAQIKKAWQKMSKNYATGQPWTRDDAIAALVAQGYSTVDANDFLDIPAGK